MNNILSEMKPSLVRYSEIISNITDSAVSIIDNEMIRVLYVGGDWRDDVGENCAEVGHIAHSALETGQSQIMLEPAGHPGCQNCTYRSRCKESVEMWTPIIANYEILGTLGFVAEKADSEEKILADPQIYLEFLEKIADLIGYEAMQLMENQRDKALIMLMESVFEQYESGVMILNQDNRISQINKMGKSILREQFYDFEQFPIEIRSTGVSINQFEEFELTQGEEKLLVAGSAHKLNLGEYGTVLFFSDIKKLRASQNKVSSFQSIVGNSKAMQSLRTKIEIAAKSPSCVLIHAEDGLNKKLYACAIHDESDRNEKPLVIIDCPTLPRTNAEKYLFGVASPSGKAGRIEAAGGGTLVLHNIEGLPLEIQELFVQMIETKKLSRVGSRKTRSVNLRIIATTRRDLRKMSAEGAFNSSLYYLISVIPIEVPSLRSRREDIRSMAITYIRECARRLDKTIRKIDDEFWRIVETYDWPGNIQELKNTMEYVVNMLMDSDTIQAGLLPEQIRPVMDSQTSVGMTLEEMEREYIRRALEIYERNGSTREETAHALGIGPATLYRKIKKYGL
ncbi:MAG: sigma-54-dependent Fis family transcriptional regulator [Lachnospiraceae bacterium]|nr:sigma-54-dependent Fis family transcriptional regulator [Lachnospiraceae bacterium]